MILNALLKIPLDYATTGAQSLHVTLLMFGINYKGHNITFSLIMSINSQATTAGTVASRQKGRYSLHDTKTKARTITVLADRWLKLGPETELRKSLSKGWDEPAWGQSSSISQSISAVVLEATGERALLKDG